MHLSLTATLLMFTGLLPAFAAPDVRLRSTQLDPHFAYYRDRSEASIAAELKVNGYRWMRYLVTRDSTASAPLVVACQQAGLTVWYATLGNGTYDTHDLPPGWEQWRMRLRDPGAEVKGYTYLCLNHPEYRRWKKAQTVATLKRIPFDGFEVPESFWPAFNGPNSALYGCMCDHCRAAFQREVPDAKTIPSFTDATSPDYYRSNRALYAQWVEFRANSVAAFLDELINGTDGIRSHFPKLPVGIWGIADDIPDAVATLREWEGIDGALLVTRIKPDLYVVQTDWPDWANPGLTPEYVLKYQPFVEVIRATGSRVPIQVQTDIGSKDNCRRGSEWMRQCEGAAKRAGMSGVVAYEYHLSRDIYEAPPRPMTASGASNTVTLVFNKRLDPTKATGLQHYAVTPGSVVSAEVDGNIVKLNVSERPGRVTVRGLTDDPARRLFKQHPAVTMPEPVSLRIRWP